MPRGTHPNSLANLKKGHRITSADDNLRKRASEAKKERKNFAEELKELAYTEDAKGNTRTRALAAKLLLNADKSPEWFKLFLKLLGEMPSDELLVKQDNEMRIHLVRGEKPKDTP